MKPYRDLKIASILKHELNNLLLREFEFQETFVTIISVEVSSRLLQARVKLGIIPKEKELEVLAGLQRKHKILEYKLLKKTKLRIVPKLVFEIE